MATKERNILVSGDICKLYDNCGHTFASRVPGLLSNLLSNQDDLELLKLLSSELQGSTTKPGLWCFRWTAVHKTSHEWSDWCREPEGTPRHLEQGFLNFMVYQISFSGPVRPGWQKPTPMAQIYQNCMKPGLISNECPKDMNFGHQESHTLSSWPKATKHCTKHHRQAEQNQISVLALDVTALSGKGREQIHNPPH